MTETWDVSADGDGPGDRPGSSGGTLTATRWTDVCGYADLRPEHGVCALVGDRQIALFRTHDDRLFALDNRDPFSGAYVLAHGIVGSRGGVATVASPMYKQVFDLTTGRCLDDPDVAMLVLRVRRRDGRVEVAEP